MPKYGPPDDSHAHRLAVAADDVRACRTPAARCLQHGQRYRIDHADHQRVFRVRPVGQRIDSFQHAEEIRLRDHQRGERAEVLLRQPRRIDAARLRTFVAEIELDHLDVLQLDDGLQRLAIRRMHGARHQDAARPLARAALGHQRRFGQRRGAVIKRSVADVHAGQPRHHRLVFVDQLQRALTGFGLIRRVRRIELTARHHRPHRRGNVMLVRTGAGEIQRRAIHRRARLHQPRDFHFRQAARHAFERRDLQRRGDFIEQVVDALHADGGQHRLHVGFGMGDEGHRIREE